MRMATRVRLGQLAANPTGALPIKPGTVGNLCRGAREKPALWLCKEAPYEKSFSKAKCSVLACRVFTAGLASRVFSLHLTMPAIPDKADKH